MQKYISRSIQYTITNKISIKSMNTCGLLNQKQTRHPQKQLDRVQSTNNVLFHTAHTTIPPSNSTKHHSANARSQICTMLKRLLVNYMHIHLFECHHHASKQPTMEFHYSVLQVQRATSFNSTTYKSLLESLLLNQKSSSNAMMLVCSVCFSASSISTTLGSPCATTLPPYSRHQCETHCRHGTHDCMSHSNRYGEKNNALVNHKRHRDTRLGQGGQGRLGQVR